MDIDKIKQIAEIVKTWNINVNSVTGQKAVEEIAGKAFIYFMFDRVLYFLVVVLLFFVVYYMTKKITESINESSNRDKLKAAIGELDLDTTWGKQKYNELTKQLKNLEKK